MLPYWIVGLCVYVGAFFGFLAGAFWVSRPLERKLPTNELDHIDNLSEAA